MSAIASISHVRGQQGNAVLVAQLPDPARCFAFAAAQMRETGCDQDLLFTVRVEVEERHLGLTLAPGRCLEWA